MPKGYPKNPKKPVKPVKPRPLPDPLTRDQVAAILDVPNVRTPRGLRFRAILETLCRTGMRISEVLDLQPEDVRFSANMLRVRNSKRGKHRNIPMAPTLRTYLEAWDAIRPESEWFFTCSSGAHMAQQTVNVAIHGYVKIAAEKHPELGLLDRRGPVSAHTFRHTFATEALRSGYSIYEVQRLLGHASIANTQIYLHINNDDLAERMGQWDILADKRGTTR